MTDQVGDTYGELTLLKQTVFSTRNKEREWLCQCSCGSKVRRKPYILRASRNRGDRPKCVPCRRKGFNPTRNLARKRSTS